VMAAKVDPDMVLVGDFNLQGLLAIIGGKAKAMGAKRIVIDAIDVLLRLFDDPRRERNEMYMLHDWLKNEQLTSLLTVKTSQPEISAARFAFLDFMVEAVIHLDHRVTNQVATRRLRVMKYRGSGFGMNEYPYVITSDGISVISTTRQALTNLPMGDKFSTGIARLDEIINGGFRRNSSIMIAGNSGTGKTTLASIMVQAASERGEKSLYISFEESEISLVDSMRSPGLDLAALIRSGNLRVLTAMPESMGAEEHLIRIVKVLDIFQPEYLTMDATSSCSRMGTEKDAFDFIMRLTSICKTRGITCILIKQTKGIHESDEISGNGFSSILDAILFMRYSVIGGEINRMLNLMKIRGSSHSNQYREYQITDDGIDILDLFNGEGGVLTGTARIEQEAKAKVERRHKELLLEQKKAEILRLEKSMQAEALANGAAIAVRQSELKAMELEIESSLSNTAERRNARSKGGASQ